MKKGWIGRLATIIVFFVCMGIISVGAILCYNEHYVVGGILIGSPVIVGLVGYVINGDE